MPGFMRNKLVRGWQPFGCGGTLPIILKQTRARGVIIDA